MAGAEHGIELSAGDEFAGYRIEQRLGRGGMGVLYLALEPGLERRVALKLIAPEAAMDEVFARRFAEESKIAASIEHPNVVPIYAAGKEEGVPFIAMRYVAGADLAKRLVREGRLSPQIAVELIAQIGNGLDAIHAAGLIHRDVKPANVLLSGGEGAEHAYITDFGVARNVATESGLTQTGRFVGTLDYVAPEQISGGEIDARVDVYALGCLLFKLLTGEVPFPKDGDAARLFAHLNDPPPAPSLYVPEVSMALDDVVIRAMSKTPDDRYPSAGDLGRAAQAALRGERTTAPERTVATGAAATRTAETISVEPEEAKT
ncbi:MAG TPA: serine/threonine-protein kinase, partial [Solirubrobacterales bacterium]|nr:serine/threonine-protein kinase [Solirubrobacterales bacterium]